MASTTLTPGEEAQLAQTIEMFEVITESQPSDYQSLEILKEAYSKLGREQDVVKTSKRIAQAYVQMGQLSSAILEYETILQRFPDDPDVQKALKQIESKANNFSEQIPAAEAPAVAKPAAIGNGKAHKSSGKATADKVDDGRQAMHKIFVDGKIITAGDFDLCWVAPDLSRPPEGVSDPFVLVLAQKGIVPVGEGAENSFGQIPRRISAAGKIRIGHRARPQFPGGRLPALVRAAVRSHEQIHPGGDRESVQSAGRQGIGRGHARIACSGIWRSRVN